MNLALVSFLSYTAVLLAIGIWSYRIVEKVPIAKYEEEFYAAGRGLGGVVVALIIAGGMASSLISSLSLLIYKNIVFKGCVESLLIG